MEPETMVDSPEAKIARLEERSKSDREHADAQHEGILQALESVRASIAADVREAVRRCSIRHKKRCPGEKLRVEQELSKKDWFSADTIKKALIGIGIIGTLLGGAYQAAHGGDVPKAVQGISTGGNK